MSFKKPTFCENEHFLYLPSNMYLNVSGMECFLSVLLLIFLQQQQKFFQTWRKIISAFFIWMWKHHALTENTDEEYEKLEASIDICFYSCWLYCIWNFHSSSLSFIRDELLRNRYKVFFALFKNINNFTSDFSMTSGTLSLVRLDLHSSWI